MSELVVGIVQAYSSGNLQGTIILVIPKEAVGRLARNPKGSKFLVKMDGKGRLIYEPMAKDGVP